ncbi:MAG: photosynthetic reaction center cytochrome c subunit family protein [Sphingosinicella sp.]|uniref:photosynthetic reaction center cytochrome c subunit family protein n=1 Tax=Sphingosinicella sp. TaxID=1917971 RepID=UPI00403828E2
MRALPIAFAALLATAGLAPAGSQSDAKAGDTYENLQLLADLPERELRPVMERWSAALGTGCSHCHESYSDAVDTPMKLRAREMLRMVRAINASTFATPGAPQVTCWTCHRGQRVPAPQPPLPPRPTTS